MNKFDQITKAVNKFKLVGMNIPFELTKDDNDVDSYVVHLDTDDGVLIIEFYIGDCGGFNMMSLPVEAGLAAFESYESATELVSAAIYEYVKNM